MHCYETFQIPWESLHTPDRQSLQEKYHLREYHHGSGVFPTGVGTGQDAVCKRISEYSRKSLTRQSDRLNAFLGILRAFESFGTYNYWGTPIMPYAWGMPIFPYSITDWVRLGTLDLNIGFLHGLCWAASGASKARETHLPSWSWTGWSELVNYQHDSDAFVPTAEASFELSDGSVLNWTHFRHRYAEVNNSTKLSRVIHTRAPTLEIHSVLKNGLRYNCDVKMNDGWFLRWPFDTYSKEQLDHGSYKALILAIQGSKIFVMFVKRFEGRFERVWGDWKQPQDLTLLRPDHEVADNLDNTGSGITKRYGPDWDKSLALTWKTLRVG